MHRVTYNELRLDIGIMPITPLLIASGETGRFVRYVHPRENVPTAYVPGSALKGVLRRAMEQLMAAAGIFCCTALQPCSTREAVRSATDGAAIYRALCGVCQTFGSRAFSSQLAVTDLYPGTPLNKLAIHELPGDSCEAVMNEPFDGMLTLHNFARWQVGLLGQLCQYINAGRVTLGAHHGAGMGHIFIAFSGAKLTYFGLMDDTRRTPLADRLHGVGQFGGADNEYGFVYPDIATTADLPRQHKFNVRFNAAEVIIPGGDPTYELIDRQAVAWAEYVARHGKPTLIQPTQPPLMAGTGSD